MLDSGLIPNINKGWLKAVKARYDCGSAVELTTTNSSALYLATNDVISQARGGGLQDGNAVTWRPSLFIIHRNACYIHLPVVKHYVEKKP